MKLILLLLSFISIASAFVPLSASPRVSKLFAEEDEKAGPLVSGEELEMMLTEWDQPLVVDAYATW